MADIQLSQCDASAIVAAISKVLEEDYDVKINKCFGFGSDGASVMIGCQNGVAAILKKENPYLIAIHCAAHRLALASSQAATGISVIVQYRKTLSAIYSHFSHSTVHTQELLTVQKVLDEPEIKIKKLMTSDGLVFTMLLILFADHLPPYLSISRMPWKKETLQPQVYIVL